jgi:hypothetical protein
MVQVKEIAQTLAWMVDVTQQTSCSSRKQPHTVPSPACWGKHNVVMSLTTAPRPDHPSVSHTTMAILTSNSFFFQQA